MSADRDGTVDDRELMLRVRGGSRAAFARLVARYEGRLIAYFWRQGGDRELAEDCAQEVFVRLFRSRARYGPSANFATFLFTIARNLWIDQVRARKARPQARSLNQGEADDGWEESERVVAPAPGPFEHAQGREDVDRLQDALACLSEGQREVVLLGVIEELPYAEVARVLGIPVGTVKSRVHAAVQKLRGVLAPTSPPTPRGR